VSVTLVRPLVSLALVRSTIGWIVVTPVFEFIFDIGQSPCASANVSDQFYNICMSTPTLPVWVTLIEKI
jgi:hypothetical protein